MNGGFTTGASLRVTIADSEASNNASIGVFAVSSPGHLPIVMVRNIVASNNNTGLAVTANAILLVAHSVVTGNNTGLTSGEPTALRTYGDNDIDGNTDDGLGALTVIPTH
jgi:hypothetical protein